MKNKVTAEIIGDSPTNIPLVLQDIDGDGSIELIMGAWPNEVYVTTFNIYRWNGKEFRNNQNSSRFLIWDGTRRKSNILKWSKPYKYYDRKVTI